MREKRDKRDKSPSQVLACRFFPMTDGASSAYALRIGERPVCHPASLPCAPPDFLSRLVALASFMRLSLTESRTHGLTPVSGGVVSSKLSKLLNQENALSAPCLKHFRNYSGPIRVARCGFPWEKTTKRPVASVGTNCESAYAVISALRRRPRGAQECCGQA